jgi:hypothetical protein
MLLNMCDTYGASRCQRGRMFLRVSLRIRGIVRCFRGVELWSRAEFNSPVLSPPPLFQNGYRGDAAFHS